MKEEGVVFECEGERLVGILHSPEMRGSAIGEAAPKGVIVIVGGPQYRIGSHRQFVKMARALARRGHYVFRFDYRGMGDSEGEKRSFKDVEEDIRAATEVLLDKVPQIDAIILLGLCDAASAALMFGPRDPRIKGLVLMNPWVRTETGLATAIVKHYYLQRLFEKAFWKKVLKGKFALSAAGREFVGNVNRMRSGRKRIGSREKIQPEDPQREMGESEFPEIMKERLKTFSGQTKIILSGNDLTAQEFKEKTKSDKEWRTAMCTDSVNVFELREANHTFSRSLWREQVEKEIGDWMSRW